MQGEQGRGCAAGLCSPRWLVRGFWLLRHTHFRRSGQRVPSHMPEQGLGAVCDMPGQLQTANDIMHAITHRAVLRTRP